MYDKIVSWMLGAKKTLVAVTSFLVIVTSSLQDGKVTVDEWIAIGTSFVAIFGVYHVTNLVGAVSRKK